MISRRMSNMAMMLLLVFIIPIVYQSSHVLLYHSHDGFHCCSIDEPTGSYISNSSARSKHCVIAEYTFTHKDLPQNSPVIINHLDDEEFVHFYTHPGYRNLKLTKKSPRAPPYM